jgi:hypothetical protein
LDRLICERPAATKAILRFLAAYMHDIYARTEKEQAGLPSPVTVVIEPEDVIDPPPSQCENVDSLQEASGGVITQAQDCLRRSGEDCSSYASVFDGSFPGQQVQQQFRLFTDTYAALEFTTPANLNSTHDGAFTAEVLLGTAAGVRLMSISDCPGDFDASRLDNRCILSLVGGSQLRWRGADTDFRCPLEADTQYYLNIIYSTDQVGTPMDQIDWACTDSEECGNLITPVHNYP